MYKLYVFLADKSRPHINMCSALRATHKSENIGGFLCFLFYTEKNSAVKNSAAKSTLLSKSLES